MSMWNIVWGWTTCKPVLPLPKPHLRPSKGAFGWTCRYRDDATVGFGHTALEAYDDWVYWFRFAAAALP